MTDILPILLAFPPEKSEKASTPKAGLLSPKSYDKAIHEFIKNVDGIPEKDYSKSVEKKITTKKKKNLLELLDPAVNSIAYLITINHQVAATSSTDQKHIDALATYARLFLATFDPIQIRYAGRDFLTLWDWMMQDLRQNEGNNHLSFMVDALMRLDPTVGTLISPHLDVVRLCLARGVPSQALPILDKDVHSLPMKTQKGVTDELPSEEHELSNAWITEKSGFGLRLDTQHVLEYYLIGASIYIGLGIWHRARLFLECVILSPTIQHTASALQVEAYKKWVLVGLIAQGKPYPDPKTHDTIVYKSLKTLGKIYDELATDFEMRNSKKLQADAETGWRDIQDDGNAGLLREVVTACVRYRIIDLQKIYVALPVTRVAHLLDMAPGEALQTLQAMIQEGHLSASLCGAGADTVLRFHNTTSAESRNDLQAQTLRIQSLVTQIRDADRRLQLTKEYADHARRNGRGGPEDPADAMDLTWDAPGALSMAVDQDNDEDLMM